MDRETLADIAYALRDLEGFSGVADLGARAVVMVSDHKASLSAAARLTALPPATIDIHFDPSGLRSPVAFTREELARAALREETRLAAWANRALEVTTNTFSGRVGLAVFVVSLAAREHAALLRSTAGAPLTTYATTSIDAAIDAFAVCSPNVVLLDSDMPRTEALETFLRTQPRFAWREGVQWISTKSGFRADDAERVLQTLGVAPMHAVTRQLASCRFLVVDAEGASLAREVEGVALGASVEHVTGWEALERLDEGDIDVVIAGAMQDVSLPSLVRFVARCKSPPLLAIASHKMRIAELQRSYPALARYFIARPLSTSDLVRVLRR